ncbi:MAG: hypothetical protein CMP20_15305 [Rickettsiales bacterium]|nr:hypothetical protein [Rickettsiales bacterium]
MSVEIPPVTRTFRFGNLSKQVQEFLANDNLETKMLSLQGYKDFVQHIHDSLKKQLKDVCNVQTYETYDFAGKSSAVTRLTKWTSYAALRVTLETDETHSRRSMEAFLASPERRDPYYVYPNELSANYDCYDDRYDELLMWVCEQYDTYRDQGIIGNYKLEVFVPSRHDSFVLEQCGAEPVFP